MSYLDHFIFGIYPYIALSVFLLGSLIRFDRDQYSWKSDSSQLLRAGQLRWGSNLDWNPIDSQYWNCNQRPSRSRCDSSFSVIRWICALNHHLRFRLRCRCSAPR